MASMTVDCCVVHPGVIPYPELDNSEILPRLVEGYRMQCPKMCPPKL